MKFQKIHNKGQAQLFKNQYLEYLTKTHPIVIWGIYLPIIVLSTFYSLDYLSLGGLNVFFLFIGGMLFWSLTEYILHRFLFHLQPDTEIGKGLITCFMATITNIQEIKADCLCPPYLV